MESTDGSQRFMIELDLGMLRRQAGEAGRMLRGVGDTALSEGDRIDGMVRRLTQAAAGFFTLRAAGDFARKVAEVRGEFQQLEVAFRTMLQSKEKADALMSQLVRTAATTPFGLQDVAAGAKQLLAYGLAAEDVNGTLVRLGDIAAGLSVPLGDLVYLYGTTMAQGRLYTQDLNQFTGRGIPMIAELARQFGVAESEVKGLVEAGKVGFPEVRKVIESLTDEGGKFGGLMEAQSKTVTGQISNIEDAVSTMFNEIGQKSEGVINAALSGVSWLVENYEKAGSAVLVLTGVYGSYKAALIALAAVEKLRYQMTLAHMAGLTSMQAVMTVLKEKTAALNKTMLANPYALAAAAVAGLAYGIYKLYTRETEAERMQRQYNEAQEAAARCEEEHKAKVDELIRSIENETTAQMDRAGAIETLKQIYPGIIEKYIDEEGHLRNLIALKKEIAEFEAEKKVNQNQADLRSLDERIRNQEEYIGRMRTSDQSAFDNEAAVLEELKRQREIARQKVASDYINKAISAAKSMSGDELKKTIEIYRKALSQHTGGEWFDSNQEFRTDEINDYVSALENLREARKNAVHDKKYWEDKKKEAETARNALDVSKKNSEEWDKYTLQIQEAQAQIDKYSDSKSGKQVENRRRLDKELLDLVRKNQEDETALMEEGTEKRLRQIDDEFNARQDALRRQAEEMRRENKERGIADVNAAGLTARQQEELDKADRINEDRRRKAAGEAYGEEIRAMRDYLKEYGSIEQQKLAVTEEYEERIRKARSEGERLTLRKELEVRLSGFTFENISKGLDWKSLFGGVESLSRETLRPMMEQLLAYTRTDEYRSAGAQTQQAAADLIREISAYLGTDRSVTWQALADAADRFAASADKYNKAAMEEKAAFAELSEAEERLGRGGMTREEYDGIRRRAEEAGSAAAAAKNEMKGFAAALGETSGQVRDFVSGLAAALNNAGAWKSVNGFSALKEAVENTDSLKGMTDSLIPAMKDGIGKTVAEGVSKTLEKGLSAAGKGVADALSSGFGAVAGIVAQIPQLVLGIADTLRGFATGILDGMASLISLDWISGLVNSILDSVGNLTDAIFDLPENLYKCLESVVVDGAGGLVNHLTGRVGNILSFGALSSGGPASWLSGSNAEEVRKTIDRLTDRNKTLTTAIEDLTDVMKDSKGGAEYYRANREAVRLQRETNDNYKKIARAQAGYSGAHHSWNYYFGGFSQEQISRLSGQMGRVWNGDIWDLSPEEMKMLRSNVDMWDKIRESGKGGYGERVAEKLGDYIDQAGRLEELTEQWKETLTGVSFDSFYDDFVSMLSDMDADSEDFAENFGRYLKKQMISNLIANEYKDRIQKLYEDWFAYSDNEGAEGAFDLSKTEADEVRRRYEALAEEIRGRIEGLSDTFGFESGDGREAAAKGIAAVSQDSADYMNGVLTSIQGHTYSISESVARIAEGMGVMAANNSGLAEIGRTMESLVSMSGASLGCLEGIESNTARLEAIEDALLSMRGDLSDIRLKGVRML